MPKIISGRDIAENILLRLQKKIDATGINQTPHLAVILVGDHPASLSYISMKRRACEKLGIDSELHHFDQTISEKQLREAIEQLNCDPYVHGILLQLPLPPHLRQETFIELISPKKDVDGFHPLNLGRLIVGEEPTFIPCTPLGVYELLKASTETIEGKNIVIVGRSRIVGMPLSILLSQKHRGNATVTLCHSATHALASHCNKADILIAAMGRAEMITEDYVKEGAIVIDVGINRVDAPETEKGYRLVGDVAFDRVKDKVSAITPVPGGVGPMTVAMLMQNTLQAFSEQCKNS